MLFHIYIIFLVEMIQLYTKESGLACWITSTQWIIWIYYHAILLNLWEKIKEKTIYKRYLKGIQLGIILLSLFVFVDCIVLIKLIVGIVLVDIRGAAPLDVAR